MNDVDIEIGRRIRELREDRSVSAAEMSERLHTTRAALDAWERGAKRVHPSDLLRLIAALGVSVSALFEWNGERIVVCKDRLS